MESDVCGRHDLIDTQSSIETVEILSSQRNSRNRYTSAMPYAVPAYLTHPIELPHRVADDFAISIGDIR